VADKFERYFKRMFAPIVAYTGYEDIVTEEMKRKIQVERLAEPFSETSTDYEAMVYLHTASLALPLSREWYNIYTFLFSKYHPEKAKEIDVHTERISELEQHELTQLKKWIYRQQMEVRKR